MNHGQKAVHRPADEPVKPDAKVVKPIFGKAKRPEAVAAVTPDQVAKIQTAIVADLDARRSGKVAATEETPRDRFRRALDLERAMAAGQGVTREQERWLSSYQLGSEYQAEKVMHEDFGDAYFG